MSKVVVLNRAEVMKIKASSQGSSSQYSPWNTNEPAMWLKSAVRQLAKWVPTSAPDSAAAAWMPRPSKQLELGMDPDQARRILGNPSVEHPARWQYGPSWVDFECGRVSGWYSAPARPLQVERDSAHQVAAGPHGAADCS